MGRHISEHYCLNQAWIKHTFTPTEGETYSKLQLFLFTSCVSIAQYAFVRGEGCVCVEHRPSVGVDRCRKHCNVCVWTICIDVKLLLVVLVFPVSTLGLQGAQAHCGYLCQRSYSTMGEAEIDHLRVPAPIFIFVNGDRLSQVPACRLVFPISIMDYAASEPSSELRCQQVSIHCTVFAI